MTMDEQSTAMKPSFFSIAGQILDSINNQPLSGASVRLVGEPVQSTGTGELETTTDANGYFVLKLEKLPDFRLKIEINRAGYDPLTFDLPPLNPRQGDQKLQVIRLKQSLKSRLREIRLQEKNINLPKPRNFNL